MFGLPGFLLGLGIGATAAELFMVWSLARKGVHLLYQDLKYSALAAVLVVGGLSLGHAAEQSLPCYQGKVCSLGIFVVIMTPLSLWTLKRVLPQLKVRSAV
jgi:hypothetical protein